MCEVRYEVNCPVDDRVLTWLHHRAFNPESDVEPADVTPKAWGSRLNRHSLGWVGAFYDEVQCGFINIAWDGGSHAFLLDTVVLPEHQGKGTGRRLVQLAANEAFNAGCTWVHVDYEPSNTGFYQDVCGFMPTAAGLLRNPDS